MPRMKSSNQATVTDKADIAGFFIDIAIADGRGEKLTTTRAKKLLHVLHTQAVALSSAPVNDNHEIDIEYVGYVKRHLDDFQMFIPFHLVECFPKDEILDELVRAAFVLRLDEMNPICISGSATFLGATRSISDLDYCEYYLSPAQSVTDRIFQKLSKKTNEFLLIKIKCLSSTYMHPWPSSRMEISEKFSEEFSDEEAPSIKIDGIYVPSVLGPMPASNLVLLLDSKDVEIGSATKSFVFQEAVLVPTGKPPRTLVNSAGLGGYLNFLKEKAEYYLDSDPLKSLKRSLCFFLLIVHREYAEIIIEVLQSDAVELLAVAQRQNKIDSLLESVPADVASAMASTLVDARLPEEVILYMQALIRPGLEALAKESLARINVLFSSRA